MSPCAIAARARSRLHHSVARGNDWAPTRPAMPQLPALIVDDDPALARALSRVIAPWAYAEVAHSAAAARAALDRPVRFAALIFDRDLGGGECGLDVLAYARPRHPHA